MIQTGTMIDHIYIHVGHGDKTAILAVEATCAEIDVENRNDAEYLSEAIASPFPEGRDLGKG